MAQRILIVDDQQEIHDTFDRIFARKRSDDVALADFESRFLEAGTDEPGPTARSNEAPQYELDHAHSGEQALQVLQAAIESVGTHAQDGGRINRLLGSPAARNDNP